MPKQVKLSGATLTIAQKMLKVAEDGQAQAMVLEAQIEALRAATASELQELHGEMSTALGVPGCDCVRLDLTYLRELGVAVAIVPEECDSRKGRLN